MLSLDREHVILVHIDPDLIRTIGGCIQTDQKVFLVILDTDLLFVLKEVFGWFFVEQGWEPHKVTPWEEPSRSFNILRQRFRSFGLKMFELIIKFPPDGAGFSHHFIM